ncbi:MAG: hypothetical protein WC483_03810 [Candidatus Paceibacterota bacterium]
MTPKVLATLTAAKTAGKLKQVYNHPVSKFDGFPVAVFFPAAFNSAYFTSSEDVTGFRYKIFVISETKVIGMSKAWNDVLTGAVDEIRKQFRAGWNQGVSSEGHRIWWNLENGSWYQSDGQDGIMVVAELDLIINLVENV